MGLTREWARDLQPLADELNRSVSARKHSRGGSLERAAVLTAGATRRTRHPGLGRSPREG